MKRLLLVGAALLLPMNATAQMVAGCFPAEPFRKGLTEKHGEHLLMRDTNNGMSLEVWLNPETLTWTIMIVSNGVACPKASGSNLEFFGTPEAPSEAT